jgi:small-conductance mechanosensitive channel
MRLNDILKAAEINIPFPQRELHFSLKEAQKAIQTQ